MKNLTLIILVILSIFACKNTVKENNLKSKITIIGEDAASIQSMMKLEQNYEAQNFGVDLDFKPNSTDDAFNKSNQDFIHGTGLYDIIMQYNFSLSSFVRNNYVANIDNLTSEIPEEKKAFEKDLFPNAWKEVGYYYKNGSTSEIIKVGYPFASNTMFMVYNKTLFEDTEQQKAYKSKYKEDLQIPTSWEQYLRIVNFFNQPQKGIYGTCLQGATGSWLYYEWMNFLFGVGGKVMDKEFGWQGDENTKVLLNTPEALKALNLYKGCKAGNYGNFTNVDAFEQVKLIKENKIAISIIWSDLAFGMIHNEDNSFDLRFGFALIPGGKSILAGGSYFVNAKSKNSKQAVSYIIDLMQPKTQIELTKKGLSSALRTVYDDSEVQKIPYALTMRNSLERGVYMLEAGPDANMVSEKITTYIQKFWNNELSAEKTLELMQNEIQIERIKIFSNLKK